MQKVLSHGVCRGYRLFFEPEIVSIQPILLGEGAVRCSFRKLPHGFLKNTSQLSFLNRAGAVGVAEAYAAGAHGEIGGQRGDAGHAQGKKEWNQSSENCSRI